MANDYRQTTVEGTSYVRGRSMYFENPLDAPPSVFIWLEEVINLSDGRRVTRDAGEIVKTFEDLTVEFPLRDPETNDVLEGQVGTYGYVFLLLFSAFWHLAQAQETTP